MKKSTINQLNEGLNKDIHPLKQKRTTYTDALNATVIKMGENEFIFQTDNGNEYKTSLDENYIPLNCRVFNDVCYIISHNSITGKTQIGTYPSPRYTRSSTLVNVTFNVSIGYSSTVNLIAGTTYIFEHNLTNSNVTITIGSNVFNTTKNRLFFTPTTSTSFNVSVLVNSSLESSCVFTVGVLSEQGLLENTYKPLLNVITTQTDGTQLTEFDELINMNEIRFVDIELQQTYDRSVNFIWTDNYNPLRIINSRFAAEGNSYFIIDRRGGSDENLYLRSSINNRILLQLKDNTITNFQTPIVQIGGSLPVGNYTFYFKYVNGDFNETDIVDSSGIVPIFNGNTINTIRGGRKNSITDKQVLLNWTNVNTNFKYIKIFYTISTGDDVNEVVLYEVLNSYLIAGTSLSVIISGVENVIVRDLAILNVVTLDIKTAKTITQIQNRLLVGNITTNDNYYRDLELFARTITITPQYKQLNAPMIKGDLNDLFDVVNFTNEDKGYYNPKNVTDNLGYWSGETYIFSVRFKLNDGSITPAFPIRGIDNYNDNAVYNFSNSITDDNRFDSSNNNENINGVYRFPNLTKRNDYNKRLLSAYDINNRNLLNNPYVELLDNSGNNITDSGVTAEDKGFINVLYPQFSLNWLNLNPSIKSKIIGIQFLRGRRINNIIAQGWSLPTFKLEDSKYLVTDSPDDDEFLYKTGNPFIKSYTHFREYNTLNYRNNIPENLTYYQPSLMNIQRAHVRKGNAASSTARSDSGFLVSFYTDSQIPGGVNNDRFLDIFSNNRFAFYSIDALIHPELYRTDLELENARVDFIAKSTLTTVKSTKIDNLTNALNSNKIIIPRDIQHIGRRNLTEDYLLGLEASISNYNDFDSNSNLFPDKFTSSTGEYNRGGLAIQSLEAADEQSQVHIIDKNSFNEGFGIRLKNNLSLTAGSVPYFRQGVNTDLDPTLFDTRPFIIRDCLLPLTYTISLPGGLDPIYEKYNNGFLNTFTSSDVSSFEYYYMKNIFNQNAYQSGFKTNPYVELSFGYLTNIYKRNPNQIDFIKSQYPTLNSYTYQPISNWIVQNDSINAFDCFRGDCYITSDIHSFNKYQNNLGNPNLDVTWFGDYVYLYQECNLNPVFRYSDNSDIVRSELFGTSDVVPRLSISQSYNNTIYQGIRLGHSDSFVNLSKGLFSKPDSKFSTKNKSNSELIYSIFNVVTPFNVTRFSTRIAYSNFYAPNSIENSFRNFQGLQFQDYDIVRGEIISLVNFNNRLICIQENGIIIIPFNERTMVTTNTSGDVVIGDAGVLLPYFTPISDSFGTRFQSSIVQTPFAVYGVDTQKNKIWKIQNDKLNLISDFKIQSYVKDNYSVLNDNVYNTESNFIRSFQDAVKFNIHFTHKANNGETNISFNEYQEQFVSRHSWIPINGFNVNGIFNTIGKINNTYQIWSHDSNQTCNYYGEQKTFEFEIIINELEQLHKILNNFKIVSNNSLPISISYQNDDQNHTQTIFDMVKFGRLKGNTHYKEDHLYVMVTPAISNKYYQNVNRETRLRDKYFKVKFTYSGEQYTYISFIETIFTISYS